LENTFLHTGNRPFFHLDKERVVAGQWEHQAWDFAFELLMPPDQLLGLLRKPWNAPDLQERFEVTEEIFRKRIEALEEDHSGNRGRFRA
jgi:Zn-dependent peptidase ImmA (M78 family)